MDRALVLNGKNPTVVAPGMVFNVCVALSEIPLADAPPRSKASMAKLQNYAIVLGEARWAVMLDVAQGPCGGIFFSRSFARYGACMFDTECRVGAAFVCDRVGRVECSCVVECRFFAAPDAAPLLPQHAHVRIRN